MRFRATDMLRRLLVLCGTILAASNATAVTVDFEDLTLATSGGGAYWNGSDESGGFASRGLDFNNSYEYNSTYDYESWSGWSYSNTSDTATPGPANQYSAYAGGAYSGTNYGVYYAPGTPMQTVTAAAPGKFDGMYVTNTTYAALSMLYGDFFGKQFGGVSGDDEDWFLLTITGKDDGGAATGEVEFYLADYRFKDNDADYIVDDWRLVDLSALGDKVMGLEFALSSSDVGEWGMNTPAYFAMDNLTPAAVPEPGTFGLLAMALLAIGFYAWRKRRNRMGFAAALLLSGAGAVCTGLVGHDLYEQSKLARTEIGYSADFVNIGTNRVLCPKNDE